MGPSGSHNRIWRARCEQARLKGIVYANWRHSSTIGDAARQGDVVVLALPWNVAESAVKALGDLRNKIVIDAMNPLVMKDGVLKLERGFTTSGGETVASWLPGAKVVKT
jgi:predicted dinucleotide-binding enzyme